MMAQDGPSMPPPCRHAGARARFRCSAFGAGDKDRTSRCAHSVLQESLEKKPSILGYNDRRMPVCPHFMGFSQLNLHLFCAIRYHVSHGEPSNEISENSRPC